jgi:hypothetical protein
MVEDIYFGQSRSSLLQPPLHFLLIDEIVPVGIDLDCPE